MTLTEFLLARIAEDEALAKAIPSEPYADADVYWEGEFGQGSFNGTDGPYLPAVMRYRPSMVLAECEAKRKIVEAHTVDADPEDWAEGTLPDCPDCWQHPPCHTIRLLALPYASHPDFDPSWAA